MWPLTPQGQTVIDDLARRHGVSSGAAMAMLAALVKGGGTMAQFSHPEFGGMGQWSRGGMTMVGDMFNNALKARVDGLCAELSALLANDPALTRRAGWSSQSQTQSQGGGGAGWPGGLDEIAPGEVSLFVAGAGGPGRSGWPAELGAPSSSGAQNDIRYAFFPATRRLAIEIHGRVTIYDTGDHRITGVSQQQSGDASLSFTSQRGLVRVADLRVVSLGEDADETRAAAKANAEPAPGAGEAAPKAEASAPAPAPAATPSPAPMSPAPTATPTSAPPPSSPATEAGAADDIFFKIERLAELRQKGVLTDDEFSAKKAELLSRL